MRVQDPGVMVQVIPTTQLVRVINHFDKDLVYMSS